MTKKFKNIIMTFASLFVLATPLALPAMASAVVTPNDINRNLCSGSNFDVNGSNSANCDTGSNGNRFNALLRNIVNIFSAIVGIIAVIMIIVGGLRYVTSGGDSAKVSTAKNSIIYAIVGLVIVALSQLIVHFVLAQSSTLTT
jgi:cytochrome bd-type quinol oxidase subunit 2